MFVAQKILATEMPSDVAKIIAVKKSRKDFTIRISKFPVIPSFIAPKFPFH